MKWIQTDTGIVHTLPLLRSPQRAQKKTFSANESAVLSSFQFSANDFDAVQASPSVVTIIRPPPANGVHDIDLSVRELNTPEQCLDLSTKQSQTYVVTGANCTAHGPLMILEAPIDFIVSISGCNSLLFSKTSGMKLDGNFNVTIKFGGHPFGVTRIERLVFTLCDTVESDLTVAYAVGAVLVVVIVAFIAVLLYIQIQRR